MATKTIPVLSNMLDDIKRFCFVSYIVIQIIFFCFYGISIYNNLNNLFFLISYISILIFSIITFILFLLRNKKNKFNKIARIKNFYKYFINLLMIIFTIVELIKYGIDDFSKFLLIISTITLTLQIFIEFVKIFFEKYVEDLKYALSEDFSFFNLGRIKSNTLKIVDAPLKAIANLKNGKEEISLPKEELRSQKHIDRFNERKEKNKKQDKIEKLKIKKQKKEAETQRVEIEKSNIKRHLKAIFSKKEKNNKNLTKENNNEKRK